MLDEPIPDVRPGFTCTADITTATRQNVTAVPIPAVAVRELVYDANGAGRASRRGTDEADAAPTPAAAGCRNSKPGQTRKETEGVFVRPRRRRPSSCRSRWASRATSTSRC